MFLWLGSALSPQWVQSVLGVSSVNEVNPDKSSLPALDNPLNNRIREIIACVQSERRFSMRVSLSFFFFAIKNLKFLKAISIVIVIFFSI